MLDADSGVFLRSLTLCDNKITTENILELLEIINNSQTITKLKIANQDLNHQDVIDKICEIIERSQIISHLDISWSNTSPKYLGILGETLANCPNKIRYLNISYNSLKPNCEDSQNFSEVMMEYLKKTQVLNHLNMSGMCLTQDFILDIVDIIATVKSPLMAVHLSDLDIKG